MDGLLWLYVDLKMVFSGCMCVFFHVGVPC